MPTSVPVPPIPAHPLMIFLLQIGVLLLVAILLGRVAKRFGMPAVVGELCTGVLLGPSVLSHAWPELASGLFPPDPAQFHLLDAVGQVGVLLLVGITGLHLDFGLVRRHGGRSAAISFFGLVIPLGLGIGTGLLLPPSLAAGGSDPVVFALFLGVAMCVSAIPVIAKTLFDMNFMHRDIGQLTLAAGMVDDAFGWFMLSIVSAMATSGLRTGSVVASLAVMGAVIVFAIVVGRPLSRGIYRVAGRTPELPIPVTVTLILLAAAGTHALGLEAIFGAFLCGILISEYGKPDPAALAPLRTVVLGVFAPIFFATAGLRMDLTALTRLDVLGLALLVLAIAIVGKFAGAYLGARLSRMGHWEGLALGAAMNARGVIEVIVAMAGLRLGVLTAETYTIIVLVAVITSLMAPPLLRVAMARVEHNALEQVRLAGSAPLKTSGKQPTRSGI
ncbi:cation:proton antiporter [Nonomuraea sp. NN258]|uniref:cation:proton antiporter n=1 Tax=Nonomuraea antri TaxID=2730852 RepID=UPI00156998E2|nr:cation:proton antiporter [Nonomuraea antri]NRQ35155.1 cation:proton antiporter [Nonomuraea antri]